MVWSLAETGILVFVVSGLIEVVLYFYIIQNTGGVLVSLAFHFLVCRHRLGHGHFR